MTRDFDDAFAALPPDPFLAPDAEHETPDEVFATPPKPPLSPTEEREAEVRRMLARGWIRRDGVWGPA